MDKQRLPQDVLTLQSTIIKSIDNTPFRVIENKYFTLPHRYYYYHKDVCKLLKIDDSDNVIADIPLEYRTDFLIMDLDGNTVKATYINGRAFMRLLLFKSPLPEHKKDLYMSCILLD